MLFFVNLNGSLNMLYVNAIEGCNVSYTYSQQFTCHANQVISKLCIKTLLVFWAWWRNFRSWSPGKLFPSLQCWSSGSCVNQTQIYHSSPTFDSPDISSKWCLCFATADPLKTRFRNIMRECFERPRLQSHIHNASAKCAFILNLVSFQNPLYH